MVRCACISCAAGAVIWPNQTYYSTKDVVTGRYKAHKLKGEEVAHVEQVRGGDRTQTRCCCCCCCMWFLSDSKLLLAPLVFMCVQLICVSSSPLCRIGLRVHLAFVPSCVYLPFAST